MAVNPMLTSAGNSIQQGIKALDSVAQEIAEMNLGDSAAENSSETGAQAGPVTPLKDTAEAMVELKLYQRQVQASAKVVQTADEVLGFLLDVHA